MILLPKSETGFTQIPNDLISCRYLNAAQKLTWIMIASICWNGKSPTTVRSWKDVAQLNDIDYKKFMDAKRSLERAGGLSRIDGYWMLTVPTKQYEETIQHEIEDQPKRKHSISQKEAWALVKAAWNKEKPEAWLRLDGSMNLPVMIALETHAKRLGIERENYGSFVGQVCRGATADSWWSTYNAKASSVFGFSKVTDKKFENVEKLYKLAAHLEPEVDYTSDAELLKPYHKRADRTDLVNVKRILVKDREEAVKLDSEIEKVPATAYFYFVEGQAKPVAWSNDFKFPYSDFFQE